MSNSRGHSNNSQYIWNIVGTISSVLISTFLLLVATRLGTSQQADIFALAYTIAQQLYIIGIFGVRPFQSTDVKEEFSFQSYLSTRIVTIVLMNISLVGILALGGYSLEKLLIVLFVSLYRSCDAFSDVYQGFFQQQLRSDLAGKILFYRSVFSATIFVGVVVLSKSLLFSSVALFLCNFSLTFLLDFRIYKQNFRTISWKESLQRIEIVQILKACFPLFFNGFLINYIFSEPKLAIDELLEVGKGFEGMQRDFNVLFMPTFVLNLLFIVLRPLLTQLSLYWTNKEYVKFNMQIKRITLALLGLEFIVLLGGYVIGLPILGLVFGVNLLNYKMVFMILLLGGLFNLFATLIDNIMTIYRKQRLLVIANIVAFVISKLITTNLVNKYGLVGASVSFLISMVAFFSLSFIIYIYVKKEFKE
ncbi:lipopolysaccharide biosynthesis protein [Streptococcus suis]|uniref:lipopolysaccharide biosynthesis protein n=1 Tax=Streptococcus suis TaxID=1307 RepID=UPI002B1AD9E8|nr:lipopolysaccharide biosynthesis protein [Streptococcus suis]